MWGVLVSKIPQKVVGTVPSAPTGVARNTQQGHRGKEGRRTLVIDVFFRGYCYHTVSARYPAFSPTSYSPLFPAQDTRRGAHHKSPRIMSLMRFGALIY